MIQNMGSKNTKSARYPTTAFIDQTMANKWPMVKGAAAIFVHVNQLEKLDTSLSRQELPGVIADRGK